MNNARIVRKGLALAALSLLVACSEAPPPDVPRIYPDAASPGGKVFLDRCGRCHAPPLPSTHPSDEWSNVVYRMENHMVEKGYGALNEADRATLLGYLTANGGRTK